jgi:hypothetical protein
MRRMTIVIGAAAAVAVAGCGSSTQFANNPRPAQPVDLTVYINDQRVSISPTEIGAGPINFIVTNQATRSESLQITGNRISQPVSTGPISPQATATVSADLPTGTYTVTTGADTTSGIAPTTLRLGAPRASAKNLVLQP